MARTLVCIRERPSIRCGEGWAAVTISRMDAIAGLLDGPRAHGAFLLRLTMSPPWSLRIQDEAPLAIVAIVRGHAWVVPDDRPAVRLTAGDVIVIRGPEPYRVADDPATPAQIVIHPGQVCTTPSGESLDLSMKLGLRAWGNSRDGAAELVTGVYQLRTEVSRRLLTALPALAVVRAGDWDSPLVDLLAREVGRDDPGQEIVLDRLLDLLVVAVVRTWFAWAEAAAPAWWRANDDPVVGPALRLVHHTPQHPWTVAELAAACGASRAAFARRFTDLVGEPPIAYLTGWRLALAADLLREPDASVGSVARRVGYGSPFALSTAFRRHYGVSPREHRAR